MKQSKFERMGLICSEIVSFFGPGARRFAGYGCWIKVSHCPKDPTVPYMFFDAWGDTNRNTGHIIKTSKLTRELVPGTEI